MTSALPVFSIRNGETRMEIGKSRTDPLPRLLHQLMARGGGESQFVRAATRPWASALFQGRRHSIEMLLTGEDVEARADRFAAGLDETQWSLVGHFVADITIDAREATGQGVTLSLSALTIEDW